MGWDDLYGRAGWSNEFYDMSHIYETKTGKPVMPLSSTVPIGYETRGWCYQTVSSDEGQLLCFAPNGTGKGASVIIPALLTYGGSMFCIDPKGENCFVASERRRKLGQTVITLDPFNEVNRVYGEGQQVEKTTRFNPLLELKPDIPDYADDVKRICEGLVIKHPNEVPHWPNSTRDFIGGCISAAKEKFGDAATFRTVRKLITGDADVLKDILSELEEEAREANRESYAVTKLRRFFTHDTDEVKNVRSNAETALSFLDSAGMLDHFDGEDESPFTFSQMLDGRTTVFIVLPPDRLETHSRWLRLMLVLCLKAITRAPSPPASPYIIICDEMGTIGPLETLESGFALFRGYGIRFFGFLQSVSQIQRDYPKSWNNFVANCSYLQCLGARDMETAEFISKQLGDTTWQSRDRTRQEKRPLMLPDEVISMLGNDDRGIKYYRQVLIRLDGNKKFLHYQNPYFLQPGWSTKYRQKPWQRTPWPQAAMPTSGGQTRSGSQTPAGIRPDGSPGLTVAAKTISFKPPVQAVVAVILGFLLKPLVEVVTFKRYILGPVGTLSNFILWGGVLAYVIILAMRYKALNGK